jgi:transposase, IS30 family
MATNYTHLTCAERTTLMVMRAEGASQAAVADRLGRSRSTISRELARNAGAKLMADDEPTPAYDGVLADERARLLREAKSPFPKLAPDSALFGVVKDELAQGWSPEQIAGRLKKLWTVDPTRTVCHETIYTAIYAIPRGALRTEMIDLLRQGHTKRRPRTRGVDRRGQIPDMISIHCRPPEVEDRLIPGHWEGDLIKGAYNQSCVGTLVERTSRLVLLAKIEGSGTAEATLEGFTTILNRVHPPLRKTLTYDQGKEMSCHKALTEATNVTVYFADPHSPWQRGSNENTNGLLRQYLPKGSDLSTFTQDDLDAIAYKLNTRPRKMHDYSMPLEVYAEYRDKL